MFYVLMVTGPRPRALKLPKLDTSASLNLKNFNENSGGQEPVMGQEPLVITAAYEKLRAGALSKSKTFINNRDTLNLAFNIMSVVSIIASFMVTIIGAAKGVHLTTEKLDQQLNKLKLADTKFKRWVIGCSAVAVLSTTLANRFSAYADKQQSQGIEIIDMVKTADAKVAGALDIKEVKNAADALELDLAKY